MNIQDFKIFVDLVHHNSFSQAAAANHVSQSAVSQTVRRLEQSLNCQMIDRSVRPFLLTSAGQKFFEGSKKILNTYDALRAEVASSDNEVVGVVRLAAIYSIGLHEMSRLIQQFSRMHPGSKIRLSYVRPNLIYDMLKNEEADLGVISYPHSDRDIKVIPWRNEHMALVCHPDHPLAMHSNISAEELEGANLISFDPDLKIRREIDKWLARHDVSVNIVMEFDNIENIKQAIENRAGASILPVPTVEHDIHHRYLAIVPLDTTELNRPVGFVYSRRQKLSRAARTLIDFLTQSVQVKTGSGFRGYYPARSIAE